MDENKRAVLSSYSVSQPCLGAMVFDTGNLSLWTPKIKNRPMLKLKTTRLLGLATTCINSFVCAIQIQFNLCYVADTLFMWMNFSRLFVGWPRIGRLQGRVG